MSEMTQSATGHQSVLFRLLRRAETYADIERRDGRKGHAQDRDEEVAALRWALMKLKGSV